MRASYVVAADGAHSPIREQLGIRTLGHGSFSDCITIYFRADVRRLVGDRNLSVVYVLNPRLQGFFRFSSISRAASSPSSRPSTSRASGRAASART